MHRKEGLYAVKQLFRISWKTVMAYSDKVKRHLVKQFIQHGIATKQTDTSGQLYIEGLETVDISEKHCPNSL